MPMAQRDFAAKQKDSKTTSTRPSAEFLKNFCGVGGADGKRGVSAGKLRAGLPQPKRSSIACHWS